MIQLIEVGGLRLADLDTRVQIGDISLIRYLWTYQRSFFASVLTQALQSDDLQYLILCKANLVSSLPDNCQLFRQILSTLSRFPLYSPTMEQEIQDTYLWHKDRILTSKKTAFWHDWKAAGITQIRDLTHSTVPWFLSRAEIAVECLWKRLLISPRIQQTVRKPSIQAANKTVIDVSNTSSKKVYSILITFKFPIVSSQAKWEAACPHANIP